MARTFFSATTSFLVLFAVILAVSSSPATVLGGGGGAAEHLSFFPMRKVCEGTLGECLGEEEFEMDSEISRRILATTKYISYGALQRNTVPCSRRGASYYNCKPGASANPYSRGCSAITRCRS